MEKVRLSDRYDLSCSSVLLNGTQALVRLMLTQKMIDQRSGLRTAGYVTGYRGSPLGALDMQMNRAQDELNAADILFHPAINEDLAATALWGSQQAELRGEGSYDGVFGLWYGKGPGVDRSGDVFRHANFAGTSPNGGVILALGDDHTGESSTTLHQSEWSLIDTHIPVLSPAGVQEILDYGIFGFALSRYSGNWVGIKCMKETVEATSVVRSKFEEKTFKIPDFEMPPGGLNIRLIDTPKDQEDRTLRYGRFAAEAFGHANHIDKRVMGCAGAKIGFVSSGKVWLDLQHAMELLDIDETEAKRLGITTYKVGMIWPLDETGFIEWADGLDLIIVIEEKRKLIEPQIKDLMFNQRQGLRVYGRRNLKGEELFPTTYALDPIQVAQKIGGILIEEGRVTDRIESSLTCLEQMYSRQNIEEIALRTPYFCSGCPHNTSTKVPEGSRAYAGIGCHYMVQWMDRETIGFTQMGGEGANWIGEAPFSNRKHVFQNVGDGTYNHSGIMAIRAAIAANTHITFKLLFNDAVAMTGGQKNDGGLTAGKIAFELKALGVQKLAVVYDPSEDIDFSEFPRDVEKYERSQFNKVQKNLREIGGVTAIIYVQTCAAEKRRRRKRDLFPDPDRRIFINSDICEGCGDCGLESNCVSIVPIETEFGRKRAVDQSSCNKDFSCMNGFCPSFVSLKGANPKEVVSDEYSIPDLPSPELFKISGTHNVVITGIGGTGVVTVGAILAMASYIDGKGVGMIEMAGLAQKGGAVTIHCRIANSPEEITAIRVDLGEADCIIGGDLVVTASSEVIALTKQNKSCIVVNSHEILTGDFTRDTEFKLPMERLCQRLEAEIGSKNVSVIDSSLISKSLLGDSIYSNMILMGVAWQQSTLPLSKEAIETSIRLNGAAADKNLAAFSIGRWWAVDPVGVEKAIKSSIKSNTPLNQSSMDIRREHLLVHSGRSLVKRYEQWVNSFEGSPLQESVIQSYHKLLAIKDEYEVARLHLNTAEMARNEFEDGFSMTFSLAPPFLPGKSSDGRPQKREFGMWILKVFWLLSKMRKMRGTVFDIFGYSKERKLQKKLIQTYEQDMKMLLSTPLETYSTAAVELAGLPLQVRGYGPVWENNYRKMMARRKELLSEIKKEIEVIPQTVESV